MKLLSFEIRGKTSYGALGGGGIVDLGRSLVRECPLLRDLLERGDLRSAAEVAAGRPPNYSLEEVVFLPPIPAPEKIVCLGVNYRNRNEEYRDASELPRYRVSSSARRTPWSATALCSSSRPSPRSSTMKARSVIIGKRGRRIAPSAAREHVAGLTCMNEGTIRDWLRHAKFNVTQGKNFERSGSIGPWMTTADEFEGFEGIRLTTRVNGQVRRTTAARACCSPSRI